MMRNTRIAISIVLFLLSCSVTLAAGTLPKFRASRPAGANIGHYIVTLPASASSDDLAAMKQEVTVLYGAALEDNASAGVRQFAAAMTPAHAKLLSSDPRVSEVAAVPVTMPAVPAATPSSARHFAPQTSGYGDNGQSGTYTYDSSGNITAIGADTFLYDAESRLTQAVIRGVTEAYVYDAFGNRKSATGATNCLGQTICAQPVTVDKPTNRLLTINGAAVHYDAPGNITNIDATSGSAATVYLYDGTEMMTESIVASDDRQYVYTADDERIAVKRGASWTWTVRDLSNKVLREFTSVETGPSFAMTGRAWVKDYVWRDGLLLATTTPTGTLHYHLDHLGTPRLITDANRLKVAEHAYYPFGAEINLSPRETPEEAMKFTGHERDIVAGDGHTLDYMHARYYNAASGRFASVDPVLDTKLVASSPQGWNRYAYVRNNPLNKADPTGKCEDPGGKGTRICVEAFIPQKILNIFKGDNRGAMANGGSFRLGAFLNLTTGGNGILESVFKPGASALAAFPAVTRDAHVAKQSAEVAFDGIRVQGAASDGLLFGAAPNLKFDLTLLPQADGKTEVFGSHSKYPSLEVWKYQDGAQPELLYKYDAPAKTTSQAVRDINDTVIIKHDQ